MAEQDAGAGAAVQERPADSAAARSPVVVKKYANRRLYNTEASSYVTLEDLAGMVRLGRDFVVYDAKSGEDITRSVLTQIIVEEEAKGRSMLPESFLRQLIGFYGDSLQSLVPRYLEFAMGSFHRQQEQMRRGMEQAMGGFLPFGLKEMGEQNRAMVERAMTLFAPFRMGERQAEPSEPRGQENHDLEALRAEVEALKRQLATLQHPDREAGSGTPPAGRRGKVS